MGPQKVHGPVKRRGGIVFPYGLHVVAEGSGVTAAQPRQQRRPEGIVHQPVGLPPQKIAPASGVGDLVAAVLPHLTQQIAVGLLRLDGVADGGDKVIRQLVGHVQPPAVGPVAEPVPHHGIFARDDEPPVVRLLLVHRRQGVYAPPGIVVRGPRVKAVPVEIRRFRALGRARLGIESLRVEVPAVGAGVVEHTVQNNVDASSVSLAAQRAEVLLRAQQGINGVVICRVVAVVAVRFKYGVEIEGGHR